MQTILITGANRGLGLEFVRQYVERGDRVYAGCREPETAAELQTLSDAHPGQIYALPLDMTDEATMDAARQRVEAQTESLDVLINNAGCYAPGEPGLFKVESAKMLRVFAVNAVAPVLMAQKFAPLLAKGKNPRVASVVSGSALLFDQDGAPGKQYSYGASKAALNFMIRQMAFDLRPQNIINIGLEPGFVLTDMTRGSSVPPPLLPPESVRGMIAVLDRLDRTQTGRFFRWSGEKLNWLLPPDA